MYEMDYFTIFYGGYLFKRIIIIFINIIVSWFAPCLVNFKTIFEMLAYTLKKWKNSKSLKYLKV